MDWGAILGPLVFIVVIILSIASKVQESRKLAERQRQKGDRSGQQLSGKARQQIHGRVQPKTATAREGQSPPVIPPQRPVRKPRPVEQELLETLFGVKLTKDEDATTGPQPVRPPNVREATQQMVQRLRGESPPKPRPAPARKTPPRVASSAGGGDEGPSVTVDDMRKKEVTFERQVRAIRQRMHQSMREGLAQAPEKPAPQKKSGKKAAQPSRPHAKMGAVRAAQRPSPRLFGTRADVRHAIIVSEVLGPPKSMRDDSSAA